MTKEEAQFWLCVAAIACKCDGDASGFDALIDAIECVSDVDKRAAKRMSTKLLYAEMQLGENKRRDVALVDAADAVAYHSTWDWYIDRSRWWTVSQSERDALAVREKWRHSRQRSEWLASYPRGLA